MKTRFEAFVLVVALLVAAPAVPAWQTTPAGVKTLDTGLGFTISVPESWEKGPPDKNNKFVAGDREADFSVVVSDFGPAQSDTATADKIYRASFVKYGLDLKTEAEMTVSGRSVRRYVFAFETPDGPGHAEGVILTVGDEVYSVLVVTPAAAADARRDAIAKILTSIAIK